jgi:uncharacterized protein YoxC
MKAFRDIMVGLMCLCFGCAAVRLVQTFQKVEYDLNVISSQTYAVSNDVHDLLEVVKKTVDTANQTLVEVKTASAEERVALGKQNQRVLDVIEQSETTLVNLQLAVDDIDKNTGKVSEASVEAVNHLQPLLIESTNSIRAAGVLLSDPKLTVIASNVASTTDNLNKTTAHLEHTTDQIDHKVEQMLKPASLVKRVAGEILSWVAHIGDLRQAFGR